MLKVKEYVPPNLQCVCVRNNIRRKSKKEGNGHCEGALLHGSKIAMKRASFPRRRESRKLKS
ncbi:hypothetical protein [Rickettsia endosymbiont of Ceutorhynchus obstrictus]|uniref:hypothetical protein n=1 Tax=Rickettsia endosymbiont of Ceutorhynchus obstrictus TaxID=3066249 RepID=UPI003132A6A0